MTTTNDDFPRVEVSGSVTLHLVSKEIFTHATIRAFIKEFNIPRNYSSDFVSFLYFAGAIYLEMKNEIPEPSFKSRVAKFKKIEKHIKALQKSLESLTVDRTALETFWYFLRIINNPYRPNENVLNIPLWHWAKRVEMEKDTWQIISVTDQSVLEALEFIKFSAEKVSRIKSGDKGGKPRNEALLYFIQSAHEFWCIKLGRSFSREISEKGEPISPGLHFCQTILKPLIPDIKAAQVQSMMRLAVSEYRHRIGKNRRRSKT
jgi:hypothetical protein